MRIWDSWGGPFQFENAYDIVGVPQDAHKDDVEAAIDELYGNLRSLGLGEAARKRLEQAAKCLVADDRREHHDLRPETRILAIQDPYPRYELSEEDQLALIETALGGDKVSLRRLSDLNTDE